MGLTLEKDKTVWTKLQKELLKMNRLQSDVGFINPRHMYEDGLSVAQNAQWQNEGTVHIPKRPFMSDVTRGAFKGLYDKQLRDFAIMVGTFQEKPKEALENVGVLMQQEIKNNIESNKYERLSDVTIRIKGNDEQLRETERMLNSVEYKVVRGG